MLSGLSDELLRLGSLLLNALWAAGGACDGSDHRQGSRVVTVAAVIDARGPQSNGLLLGYRLFTKQGA